MSASDLIDLRSDTVTRPTPGMRAAMAAAEVGDDVYGDDPTVNRLQAVMAERFGREAALFFPSGTQSNLAALMAHCGRGDEYLVGQEAHTYKYEQGGAAVLGSIQPQPLNNQPDGSIAIDDLAHAIKPDDVHFARTRLLALENTISGRVLPRQYVQDATDFAHARGLATHLDGARIYNAIVAYGISEREAVHGFDTVSVCMSKGLGAPVGSVLVGLRQAGILAAACLYALDHHVARLADDHANAAHLGAALARIEVPGHGALQVEPVQTNVVYVQIPPVHCVPLKAHLAARGVLARIEARTRLLTHLDVSRAQIEFAVGAIADYFAQAGRA